MSINMISAITALVAVIVGPAVSLYIANRQIKAQVVSTNRQEWINTLRNDVALFVRDVRLFYPAFISEVMEKQDAYKKYDELTLIQERINLMLNPNEAEHKELARLLTSSRNSVVNAIKTRSAKSEQFISIAKAITTQTQGILKSEWERVKSGD